MIFCVDPAKHKAGYAVMDKAGNLISSGPMKSPIEFERVLCEYAGNRSGSDYPYNPIDFIGSEQECKDIRFKMFMLGEYHNHALVIETQYKGENVSTMSILSQWTGRYIWAAERLGMQIIEVNPATWQGWFQREIKVSKIQINQDGQRLYRNYLWGRFDDSRWMETEEYTYKGDLKGRWAVKDDEVCAVIMSCWALDEHASALKLEYERLGPRQKKRRNELELILTALGVSV